MFLGAVVSAHVCEALGIFPWMLWGSEDSVGHYLNLGSALLGLTLFPLGYCLYALTVWKTENDLPLARKK
jgi:hypothetical protein